MQPWRWPDPSKRSRLPRNPLRAQFEQRSLFGEILDWMLAPLLLLWPMSVTVTYIVAQTIANAPFDRSLADAVGRPVRTMSVKRVAA